VKCDKYFPDDAEPRNIWNITLKNQYWSYTFTYGDSINNTQNPILPKGLDETKYKYFMKHWKDQYLRYYWGYTTHFIEKLIKEIKPKNPTDYSILACLDVFDGDFEDFCSCFGYDEDSRKAETTYKAVLEQSMNLRRLFDRKEIEMLQEIA
jgi:hypothetical protein